MDQISETKNLRGKKLLSYFDKDVKLKATRAKENKTKKTPPRQSETTTEI